MPDNPISREVSDVEEQLRSRQALARKREPFYMKKGGSGGIWKYRQRRSATPKKRKRTVIFESSTQALAFLFTF